jgi:transposase InsO family protein
MASVWVESTERSLEQALDLLAAALRDCPDALWEAPMSLEMAMFARRDADLTGLVHHSDRGRQYLAIRSTDRLAEAEAVNSVGSRGDSYDNALAETVNGLYKAELINRRGPWRSVEQVELATAEWVHFWNTSRLHEACDYLPPAEFEAAYHRLQATSDAA